MRSELGAPPDAGFIPLCDPCVRGNEWTYVKECLDTGWVSSVGAYVDRFERMVADWVGTRCGVATVNGTAALHIALLVAGVKPGDEVLVSTLTFIAPANAVRYAGAWPVFIDAEPDYWQMDVEKAGRFLDRECQWKNGALWNNRTGRRVAALLPVHVLGHPVDMEPLLLLARKYSLPVIEDATESLGATCRGRPVGKWGGLACFSFNGNKILTTGGGGMIVTDNEAWAERAKYLTTQAKDDPVEYVHHEIGYNYRLTNLQAAMGCAQMEQLDEYIAAKRAIADRYVAALQGVDGLVSMREAPWARSVFWMFTVLIDETRFGISWRGLLKELHSRKIQTRPLWEPLHRSRAHRDCQAFECEVADRLHAQALSLPCSVGLTPSQQARVLAAVRFARELPVSV
jgi:perosamine synthetase